MGGGDFFYIKILISPLKSKQTQYISLPLTSALVKPDSMAGQALDNPDINQIILLCTFPKEIVFESALRVSFGEVLYLAKSGSSFL